MRTPITRLMAEKATQCSLVNVKARWRMRTEFPPMKPRAISLTAKLVEGRQRMYLTSSEPMPIPKRVMPVARLKLVIESPMRYDAVVPRISSYTKPPMATSNAAAKRVVFSARDVFELGISC